MPFLARRLAAVFTLLSVLLGTLGWAHPSCSIGVGETRMADRGTVMVEMAPAHHGGAAGGHDEHCAGDPAGTSSSERHGMPAGSDCAWVAHCATWTPTASVFAVASSLPPVDAPHTAYAALIPLGPDAEPDSPPPRA